MVRKTLQGTALLMLSSPCLAESADAGFIVHNLWILIAAAMVFIMHLGFACLEGGTVQPKNSLNILFKNATIMALGLVTYAIVGFNLMYPGEEFAGAFFGFTHFGVGTDAAGLTSAYNPSYTYWSDFIFQAMFAATAATIVSGAMAERVKLGMFLLFSVIFLSVIYPIVGMWKWGGGFLNTLSTPFYDFAGSTLVHGTGGWAALAGALILGPRLGIFDREKSGDFVPANGALVSIGVFLLWFGWFGFNGGSVLSAEPGALSLVFVTTALAGAAGILAAGGITWMLDGKPSLTTTLNGALGGLVGITAGADLMTANEALIIGGIGGILVAFGEKALVSAKIDDPVGAIPVHLIAGIWGTLAVGVFGAKASVLQFVSQLVGVLCVGVFVFSTCWIIFKAIDLLVGLRVGEAHETEGMDIHEHAAIDRQLNLGRQVRIP